MAFAMTVDVLEIEGLFLRKPDAAQDFSVTIIAGCQKVIIHQKVVKNIKNVDKQTEQLRRLPSSAAGHAHQTSLI
jgi:hypothetical protein